MKTISEVSPGVASGKIKSEKLTEDCLARIAELNPTLNAFITVTADQALQQGATRTRRSRPAGGLARSTGFHCRSRI